MPATKNMSRATFFSIWQSCQIIYIYIYIYSHWVDCDISCSVVIWHGGFCCRTGSWWTQIL